MNLSNSVKLFNEAKMYMPGGVNSPVRSFKAVQGTPPFIKRGRGSKIYDVDGHEYVDYVCSWGPLILGHAPEEVLSAVRQALEAGTSFGAPTEAEVRLAKMIVEAVPAIEMVRLVNSGTEATMSAVRLARAYTGRSKLVKFLGNYHGHADQFLVAAGSGAMTFGQPDSAGVLPSVAADTLVLPYNDVDAAKELFSSIGEQVAAVIVEPIAGNMGVVPPKAGFLETLRQLTKDYGALLIFDEVITGFRVAYGGAQELYGVLPDLVCLGKIIGGGLPVGAYGGRREVMENVAPLGPVYQAGTLSGNPLATAAGIATLSALSKPGFYEKLNEKAEKLVTEVKSAAEDRGITVTINRVGSMFTVFFTDGPVYDYDSAARSNTKYYGKFFHAMLSRGVNFPPSQFEACFMSEAHDLNDIELTVEAAREAFKECAMVDS